MLYNIKILLTFASVFHGIRFKERRLFVVRTSNFFFVPCPTPSKCSEFSESSESSESSEFSECSESSDFSDPQKILKFRNRLPPFRVIFL